MQLYKESGNFVVSEENIDMYGLAVKEQHCFHYLLPITSATDVTFN